MFSAEGENDSPQERESGLAARDVWIACVSLRLSPPASGLRLEHVLIQCSRSLFLQSQKSQKSRDDWIRTSDLLVPNQAHYQAVLRPVRFNQRGANVGLLCRVSRGKSAQNEILLKGETAGKMPRVKMTRMTSPGSSDASAEFLVIPCRFSGAPQQGLVRIVTGFGLSFNPVVSGLLNSIGKKFDFFQSDSFACRFPF